MTTRRQPLIVMMAGSRWENTRGTDHRLAAALAKQTPVLWIDPPVPFLGPASAGCPRLNPGYEVDGLGPGLDRLKIAVFPWFTRPVFRSIAQRLIGRAIRRTLAELAFTEAATILLSPREVFPSPIPGRRILHITDDWVAGAAMMGLSPATVSSTLKQNIGDADVVCVVSPALAGLVHVHGGQRNPVVLPNGCSAAAVPQAANRRRAVGLVGQLNERLDFDVLDAVAASGVPIEVMGPRRERSASTAARLDRFLHAEGVLWLGEIPEEEVFARMQRLAVGITPYVDNGFNRASFPIKTLDYLAAGMPVVSSDLPAARWLGSEWIDIAGTTEEFVDKVHRALLELPSDADVAARRTFASLHTWDARAAKMLDLIGTDAP